MLVISLILGLVTVTLPNQIKARHLELPVVVNTWNFTSANSRAWQELAQNHSALDAVELGCSQCEIDRCDGTVGWGGSPSESGETTLDAMIMDGETYDVGAVGGLRRVKSAISVARLVLERTQHTLLVGEMATKFAVGLGFREESLESDESRRLHQMWLASSCQPNYWKNVAPDPRKFCGPYHIVPLEQSNVKSTANQYKLEEDVGSEKEFADLDFAQIGHDTIGMVSIDAMGRTASGTSTNGLRNKILGRVGDSPAPGAGSYADGEVGAAAATGDGDVMLRFLLSYQAVENLRQGMDSRRAAEDVIKRMAKRTGRPHAHAGVIVLSKSGSVGASCSGYKTFPFVVSDLREQVKTHVVECIA